MKPALVRLYSTLLVSLALATLAVLPGPTASAPAGSDIDPFIHLAWSALGAKTNSRMGDAVAPAGDVNGDGYGDVLVAAPGDSLITFPDGSEVTVRMQAGMEGVGFDQFVLSAEKFLEEAPTEALVTK